MALAAPRAVRPRGRGSGSHLAKHLKRPVRMDVHVRLRTDLPKHCAVAPDHERVPPVRQPTPPGHIETTGDSAVGIRQQGEAQLVRLIELSLPIHLIGADSYDRRSELFELARKVAEPAALPGSTRRHGLRVEVHDHGPRLQKIPQRHSLAMLIDRLEVGDSVSNLHLEFPFSGSEATIVAQKITVR